jgi:phage/plasmid-like protein (TIGR03299 family)
MSQETLKSLNTNVLVGLGHIPWHNDEALKDQESNLYPGFIPVEDVIRRLFNFDVQTEPIWVKSPITGKLFEVPGFKAQVPDNAEKVFGIHSDGYVGHQYKKWLLEYVAVLIENGLSGIHTAGKLKDGAIGWVEIGVPEVYKTVQGVDFRSRLLATTSFNADISTIYKLVKLLVVCDNTRESALGENGLELKIKHTKNSLDRIEDAKAALHLIERDQAAFAEEIKTLCEWQVTEDQYQKFLAQLVPLPEVKPRDINVRDYSTRSATIAANKREQLNELYRADNRVAPWKGTAFGVLQAVNTYRQHLATQRNASDGRFFRNIENLISGETAKRDSDALKLLLKVTDKQLVAA